MSILAEIRASGGDVTLGEAGGLVARNVSKTLVDRVKSVKAEVIETLKSEAFYGAQYHDTSYYLLIEYLYASAVSASRFQVLTEPCAQIIAICRAIDDAMAESVEAGVKALQTAAPEIDRLSNLVAELSGWMLSGRRLHAAVKEILKEQTPELNTGAFA